MLRLDRFYLIYFSAIDEAILYECLSFLENQLNKPGGKEAIERFFTDKAGK